MFKNFAYIKVVDYSEIILDLTERKDELIVAKEDLNRAIEQVESIKASLEDLENAKKEYQDNMNATQQEYQDAIKRMQEQYENMTQELRNEFMKNITDRFNVYQEMFHEMRAHYRNSMEALILSVEDKSYGLKIASMTQRSMIMALYTDYCDTLFYHGFWKCHKDTVRTVPLKYLFPNLNSCISINVNVFSVDRCITLLYS